MQPMSPQDREFANALGRVQALRSALEAREGRPVRLIETHISWVLLAQTLAYKLKKPVKLPFLDFSTLEARRHYCSEEVRLNRRLAPDLYLGVVDVCESATGPVFGGEGERVDAAVCMQRFPDGALWSEQVAQGTLAPGHIDALAQKISGFHGAAAVARVGSAYGLAAVHERVTNGLIDAVDAWQGRLPASARERGWPALREWLAAQVTALAPLWQARQRNGRVRECHGDLHLANVLQLGAEATAFDALEFDDTLRWIDVLDDIAFLAMDLIAHGRRTLAFRWINACLEASGDYDALPTLRYYMVCRALVRAQVKALAVAQGVAAVPGPDAADYLRLAAELARGGGARLAITHGLPGSGKSYLSQGLVEEAGAIRVRSDVERKRLFGLSALQPSREQVPGGIYDTATTARTYAQLLAIARMGLGARWPMVIDAAFLRHAERADFAALARQLGVPFSILDCRAALALLRERLARRQAAGGDASEADSTVLERLRAVDEPLDEAERRAAIVADAERSLAPHELARRWRAAP
jgi:uncharacterized protein